MVAPATQMLRFVVTIDGNRQSASPETQFFFGNYWVEVRSSPKAPSIALAFLRSHLDIPNAGAQTYVVRDMQGNVCQSIFDTDLDPGPNATYGRLSHTPTPLNV